MGTELTLLLPRHTEGMLWSETGNQRYSFIGGSIQILRRREMWDAMEAVTTHPLTEQLWESCLNYDDEADSYHESVVEKDKYGTPLRWGKAEDFAAPIRAYLDSPEGLKEFAITRQVLEATAAYLEGLGDYPVIPYWS